jgi:hypothetical protein
MCRAIDECHSVDEAMEIRNKAVALAAYAHEALNRDNKRKCIEVRLRADRKAGQLLKELASNGSRRSGHGDQKSESRHATPKLADYGLNQDQSSNFQKLPDIPKERFEEELKKPGIPSTEQILSSVYPDVPLVSPIKDVHCDAPGPRHAPYCQPLSSCLTLRQPHEGTCRNFFW